MNERTRDLVAKVPQVTLVFWIIKILATTLGETGGDAVTVSWLIWRWSTGSISIETVSTPKVETFYWVTIMFSQTLGTALGDWVADTNEMGYLGAAAVFGGLLLVTALLYYFTSVSHVIL